MTTNDIYLEKLYRAIRNIRIKQEQESERSLQDSPFNIYHFGKSRGYDDSIDIIRQVFEEEFEEAEE